MINKSILASLIVLSAFLLGCNENNTMRNVDFDEEALLINMTDNIILPAYDNLSTSVTELGDALEVFFEDPSSTNLGLAQEKLKEARMKWQTCNMFDFGPASELALTAAVNIYPVDQNQIDRNINSGSFNLETLANNDAKGFPALGYLLHGQNESQTLAAFSDDATTATRVQYIRDIMEIIEENVNAVNQRWVESYGASLVIPSSLGTSAGSSLSLMFNAMIRTYERQCRDGKVGIPVGVRTLGQSIPTAVEAYFAGYSIDLLEENVNSYQKLFNGGAGIGLDDYLSAYDHADLATEINEKFEAINASISALNDPLSVEIENNQAKVEAVFVVMQDLVNLLKTDVASQLSIGITFIDMDGD